MSNYPHVAAEAGDQYLAMLAQGQDQIIEFVRSSREMMPQMPQMPGMPEGFTQMMPSLPSAREIADAQFSFATKLLKQQESFMRKFYKASSNSASAKPAESTKSTSAASKGRSAARKTTRKTKASS
jgi:hypothetical protein